MKQGKILISACLLGAPVRYDGQSKAVEHALLQRWQQAERLLPCCPEVLGGLPVPRVPAELFEERVVNAEGVDVTAAFHWGAERVLRLCREHGVRLAVLKEGSPSCGVHQVYDGTFQGKKRSGQGLTCALLEAHGVRVFSEHELPEAAAFDAVLNGTLG